MKPKLQAILVALGLLTQASFGQTAGTVLFSDDFAKPANGWTVSKTDYADFSYAEGEYRILLSRSDFNTYSILPRQKFENFSVEVDARLASGPSNGVFGILCRAEASEQSASKAYVFAIRGDGFHAILKRTSPTFWDAIAYGKESKAIKPGNASNHLRADCSGDTLTFYVNGEKVLEKKDAEVRSEWP